MAVSLRCSWRSALCGLWLAGFGLAASASPELRINGEVLPARSIALLQQALGPRYAAFMQAIQGFDFEAALSQLGEPVR